MALKEKYDDSLTVGKSIGLKNLEAKEEGGKLKLSATAEYEFDKNELWQSLKTHAGWENEIQADIKVEKTDMYGVYTVKSGDTLSKIAKYVYADANKYPKIFDANKDQLTNPDLIKVGQKLKLPRSLGSLHLPTAAGPEGLRRRLPLDPATMTHYRLRLRARGACPSTAPTPRPAPTCAPGSRRSRSGGARRDSHRHARSRSRPGSRGARLAAQRARGPARHRHPGGGDRQRLSGRGARGPRQPRDREPLRIEPGDRVAQLLIQTVERVAFARAEVLDGSSRGKAGSGPPAARYRPFSKERPNPGLSFLVEQNGEAFLASSRWIARAPAR